MSALVKQLEGEAELIRNTALWKRYTRVIEAAIEWYTRELRSNPKIGQTITNGSHWQEMVARLNKVANLLDSIISDTEKSEDKSGPSA